MIFESFDLISLHIFSNHFSILHEEFKSLGNLNQVLQEYYQEIILY
jgi:hypothetical protein